MTVGQSVASESGSPGLRHTLLAGVLLAGAAISMVGLLVAAGHERLGWDFRNTYLRAAELVAHGASPYSGPGEALIAEGRAYVYPPQLAVVLSPLTALPADLVVLAAFVGSFVQHDGKWYLEVEPTYHFTRDGKRGDRFGGSRLSGIKRLERNPAVLGQLLMWSQVLAPGATLFRKAYPHLAFGPPLTFELPASIDDALYLKHEEEPQADAALDELSGTLWTL